MPDHRAVLALLDCAAFPGAGGLIPKAENYRRRDRFKMRARCGRRLLQPAAARHWRGLIDGAAGLVTSWYSTGNAMSVWSYQVQACNAGDCGPWSN